MTSIHSMLLPVEIQIRRREETAPVPAGMPLERRVAFTVVCLAGIAAVLASCLI